MTDTIQTTRPTLADCRKAVQAKLAAVRRRLRTQLVVEGIVWGVGVAVALFAVSLLVDRFMRPDLTVRISLLCIGIIALIGIAVRQLRDPIAMKLDDLDLAELLERRQKGLGQRLTTVLQLPQLLQQDPSISRSMIEAAVRDDFAALQKIDLQTTFSPERRRNVWLVFAGLVGLVSVFWATNPAMAGLWARRWFGGANTRWPQQTYLSITGLGDADHLRVPSGETTMLQVESAAEFVPFAGAWKLNGRGEPLVIEGATKPASKSPDSVAIRIQMADGSQRIGNLTRFAEGQFRYEMPPISKPAEIMITGGDDWFGPLRIQPISRPSIDRLMVTAHTPGKSEPDVYRADDAEQQLLFLPTTKLEFEMTATEPLSNAVVTVAGTDTKIELERVNDQTFRMNWETKEPVTFEYQLSSQSGGLTSKPYFLTVGILNDRPPRLTLRSSGVGRRITPAAQIPLNLRVMDDFGVAKLALEFEQTRIVDQKSETTTSKPIDENFLDSGKKLLGDIEQEEKMALASYGLVPGCSIRIRGTASDACVLGAQSAESRWLAFQIVSADELFYDILTRQREQRAKLAKAVEASKNQIDSLRRLTTPAEAGSVVRNHQAIARQVWQIAGVLNATLQEMTLNDVGNPAARMLLEKSIIKPLYDIHATAMTEVKTKLDAFAADPSLDEERRLAATEIQTQAADQLQKILDQMSQWESFVDVVNQLRNIISSEEQIKDGTEKTQKEQIKGVFDDE